MMWTTQPRSKRGPLAYIERGHGPHVVLIHGVGLCAEAWAAQLDPLSQGHRVTVVDMPGHGQSDPIPSKTLQDYSDQLAPLITEPTVVIGHSMGAMIALDLARRLDHILGVAALNAVYQRTQEAHDAVRLRAATLSSTDVTDPTATLQRWFDDLTSAEAQACAKWLTTTSPAAYKSAYTIFAHENGPSSEDLRSLTKPALFMTGPREPNSTPAMSEAMAALAPEGRAMIIPEAAHMMPMTHAQEVNASLLSFVKGCFA